MSKKLRTLALLPILALFLTACTLQDIPVVGKFFGPSEPATPGNSDVTLTMWGLWEDQDVMGLLIAKYQETHPNVTINYENRSVMDLVDYKDRVVTRVQEASSEADIVMVHNSWVPRLGPNLAEMPSSLMSVDTYTQSFYPVIVENGIVGGKIVAVPAYYDGLVLVYNKAHFAEIGQQLPPTAWEEFRRIASSLTIRGEGNTLVRGGAAIGTANNIDQFTDILGLMWAQADVGYTDNLRNRPHYNQLEYYASVVNFMDSQRAVDALVFYTNFVKEDRVWSSDLPEATTAFIQGKASMIFVPSWQILDILLAVEDPTNVGVAAVPQAIPDDPRSWATFWMYAVPSNSPNSAAAWEFLNYLASENTQLMYFEEASKVRVFGPPYSLISLSDEVNNTYLDPVLDTAPFAKSFEIAGRAGNARQTDALRAAVTSVLTNDATAQEALSTAKTALGGN